MRWRIRRANLYGVFAWWESKASRFGCEIMRNLASEGGTEPLAMDVALASIMFSRARQVLVIALFETGLLTVRDTRLRFGTRARCSQDYCCCLCFDRAAAGKQIG